MEILKNELKTILSQFPISNRPHFDEYSLIAWETKAKHTYHFNAYQHFDIMIRKGYQGVYKENLDKKLLKKAMKDICCTVYTTINQTNDFIFALHNNPKIGELTDCELEIHHTIIYDWLGPLEEYDICIMKFEAQVFPIKKYWEEADYFINLNSKMIFRLNSQSCDIYASTAKQLANIKSILKQKISHYQQLLGVSKYPK